MNRKAKKYVLIDVPVAATVVNAQRIAIPDQPLLRTQRDQRVVIEAIETLPVTALSVSPISNLAVAPAAELVKAVLVLNVNGFEDYKFIPMVNLNRTFSVAGSWVNDLFSLDDVDRVDWSKSYVQLVAAPANNPYAFVLGVYYRILKPVTGSRMLGRSR